MTATPTPSEPVEIFFWHNIVSPHQSALVRGLTLLGARVTYVAAEEMGRERRRLGWQVPDLGCAKLVIGPDGPGVHDLVREHKSAIHVLAGARGVPLGRHAARACISSGCRVGIMSECADARGLMGFGRWCKYTLERFHRGRHFDFLLAIGRTGVRWFRLCGYPPSKIFPFAYFTEPPPSAAGGGITQRSEFTLGFAGRCVPGKGLDDLSRALAACADLPWRLVVAGDGPVREILLRELEAAGLGGRVKFLGFVPNAEVARILPSFDLLVLPSNGKEGWGAVVNEGLACGVPVLCSERCGAADLISEAAMGVTYPTGSVQQLIVHLRTAIQEGVPPPTRRERIRRQASTFSGEAGADYFLRIMKCVYQGGPRPEAPWLSPAPPPC